VYKNLLVSPLSHSSKGPASRKRGHPLTPLSLSLTGLLILFGASGSLHAETIRVPSDEPTVEAALAIATPGDEILVAEDSYQLAEGFTIQTENLTLRSEVEHGAVFVLGGFPNQLLTIEADGFQFLDFGAYCPVVFDIDRDVEGTVFRNNEFYCSSPVWPAFSDRGIGLRFESNRVQGFFGIGDTGAEAVVQDNLFIFNGSPLVISKEATVLNNRFERNKAFGDDGSSGAGGAIWIYGDFPPGGVRILQNEFVFNVTDLASSEAPGYGGAIFVQHASGVEIAGNYFTENQSRRGAALFAQDSDLVLRENIFYANSDSIVYETDPERGIGGALRLENVGGEVANNTMVGNRAGLGGGAVSFEGPSVPEFRGNLIVANWTDGATIEADDTAPEVWSCNDVFENESAVEFSGWPDPTGTNGNISAEPLFCDASAEDFTLQGDSPCLPNNSPSGCGLIGATGVGCPVATVEVGATGFDTKLRISPNPAREMVTIRSAPNRNLGGVAEPSRLRIVDVNGRLVREWSLLSVLTRIAGGDSEWVVRWDLRDNRGEPVRRGRYFVFAPGGRGQVLVLK